MSEAVEKLPTYLKKYVAKQNYDRYTPEEHAAWRYIMRQSIAYFRDHAVSSYLEGLRKTGIPTDRIPRISEMDEALDRFGWGAVPVCGFIPPAAFLDFQSRRVLPIAADMRSVNHIAYTPAPDIVHEAAGHAPILADPDYANYLGRYAQLAAKAIMSIEDIRVYEAIRNLSDTKENPDCTPEQIRAAERALADATAAVTHVSEAAQVARMNWWTAEYGLAGSIDDPRIYGAGLLSSVGESQSCLQPRVKKIPLTVDCIEVAYDITEPQPQLFVTPDMAHLTAVLDDLESRMAFRIGGRTGLERAKLAKSVTTTVLDSGVAVSGILTTIEHSGDRIDFLKWEGPVQLSTDETELPDHGRSRHASGFSSPVGRWIGASGPVSRLSDSDLAAQGLSRGKRVSLRFPSGFEVEGILEGWTRSKDQLVLFTWKDCRVRKGEKVYFAPEWGVFDMLVGESVVSVVGGPADRIAYGEYEVGLATTSPGRTSPFSPAELARFKLYSAIRDLRESDDPDPLPRLEMLVAQAAADFPSEWLIHLELVELAYRYRPKSPESIRGIAELTANLSANPAHDETTRWLSERGLKLAAH